VTKKDAVAGAQRGQRSQHGAQLLDGAIHQIADDGDHVGFEIVGGADHALDELLPEQPAHVHVAYLDDARAVEAGGQAPKQDLDALDRDLARVARTAAAVTPPTLASAALASTRAVKTRREPSKALAAPNQRLARAATSRTTSVPSRATKRKNMTPIQMNPGQASTRPRRGTIRPAVIVATTRSASPATLLVASVRASPDSCVSRTKRTQK